VKKNLLFLFILFVNFIYSQNKEYEIYKTHEVITVDGNLVEPIWSRFPIAENFIQTFPIDSLPTNSNTKVRLCYNDKFLYVNAVCYNNGNTNYVVNSLVRDFSFPRTDAFAIFLSPLQDKTNGLSFAVNPYNVQREGQLANSGSYGVSTSWNQKWFSEVKRYENFWTVEMAIPLNILKYKKNSTEWDINFARNDLKQNETSTWSPVPRGYNVASINFYGKLIWKDDLPKPKANISFVPFVAAGAAYEYDDNKKVETIKNLSRVGLDTKIGITSTLNLDITLNPDFSNTEVDDQVINLDRFSLFLPEKRLFFTENSDLFARFGFSKIRPFFSRRIGLETNILGGLRLSGNLTKDLRVGVMNIQTEGSNDSRQLESQNFSVVAAQQRVFGNSSIGVILVNKQAFNGFDALKNQRNTLLGLDFNLFSKNNKWRGKIFYHQGFNEKVGFSNSANAIWLNYDDTKWNIHYNHEFVGEEFNAEVGFVPRKGYFRLDNTLGRNFFPKKGKINRYYISTSYSQYWEKNIVSTDRMNNLLLSIKMNNTSIVSFKFTNRQTRLKNDFDITKKGTPIKAGNYIYSDSELSYNSDYRKAFTYIGKLSFGGFYDGNKLSINTSLKYNFRPRASVGINFTRNELRFPNAQNAFITLIGTQFKVSFTTDVHLSAFFQYNTQANNFNINSRLQWRFAPMSDIFLSYTDNYDIVFNQKNRALVLRINYWL